MEPRAPALQDNASWALGRGPRARRLVAGKDWSISEFTCDAGPEDRAFEEQHEGFSIAAIVEGTFKYASDTGQALMHPGALLLGNHRACYQCGHDHGRGDRCISLRVSTEFFGEVAAFAGGSSRMRFEVPMLAASRSMLQYASLANARVAGRDPLQMEEEVARLVSATLRALSGHAIPVQRVSAQDERRIARSLHHIARYADQALDLETLAETAAMSRFHFLRVFRRVVGMTPYQYLINIRLHRAANALLGSADSVAAIAFQNGFGDLSTFNSAFRSRFEMSPTAYRKQWPAR